MKTYIRISYWAFIALLVGLLIAPLVHAEPYVIVGGGITQYNPVTTDNARFCDNGFECNRVTSSAAWELGAGWKFDKPKWGLNWAAEAYYADFGTMHLTSQFPSDANYDVSQHKCLRECDKDDLYSFKGNWRFRGPVFAVLPSYPLGGFNLYGKAGLAVMFVDGAGYVAQPGSSVYSVCDCKATATRFGPVIGAGVSYEGYKYVKPFAEFNYVATFGGGFPGADSLQAYMFGVKVLFK